MAHSSASPHEAQQVLQQKLQERLRRAQQVRSIPRFSEHGLHPLSPAQRRLWILHQLEPDNPTTHRPLALRLRGPLDTEMLHAVLHTIIQRHAVLRTIYVERDGVPWQHVLPFEAQAFPLPLIDLSGKAEQARLELAHLYVRKVSQRLFQLAEAPPLRMELIRLDPDDHVLVLVFHHIAFDGWSVPVLIQELAAHYAAKHAGAPPPLPPLPVQYSDFARWQEERLDEQRLQDQRAYWRTQLQGAPPSLDVPADLVRPNRPLWAGARQPIQIYAPVVQQLREVGREHDATLYMVLLAALHLLLSRLTGQVDLVTSSPVAGRSHSDVEGLIGCFINTLVLRSNLREVATFQDLLAQVRRTTLEALSHQDLPFAHLVEDLQPARHVNRAPLSQVLFQLRNIPGEVEVAAGPLAIAPFVFDPGFTGALDLSIDVTETQGGLQGHCTYSTDLFAPATIEHLIDQYTLLLHQVARDPSQPLASYSLVTERARAFLPDPTAPLKKPTFPTVLASFDEQVRHRPEAVALTGPGTIWTYRDLHTRAHHLAVVLSAQGVQKGTVVAIRGAHSPGLIVAIFAVLRVGGVMLLVDETLPEARQQVMMAEARAALMLRVSAVGQAAPPDAQQGIVDAATGAWMGTGMAASAAAALPDVLPEDDAYIFFTSGTTGIPKGVLGTHAGLAHFLDWQRQVGSIGPPDRFALLTSLTFDVILRDIFQPLTSGATLCVPPPRLAADKVLGWLHQESVTVLHVVASLVRHWLVQAPAALRLPALRCTFFGGEKLDGELVRQWRARGTAALRVFNIYGATESTMSKCIGELPRDAGAGLLPAGRSFPNTQNLLLNAARLPCGVNEVGEVYIRTPFLTRGYINNEAATRARFVPNPYGTRPDDRMYQTGDLARYRPDGQLLVLGRIDEQVKVRGVRIEPAGIAAVLEQHVAVKTCAVLTRPNEQGEHDLVAFIVASKSWDVADVRAFAAQHLPAAQVPQYFLGVDHLPTTSSGKLDKQALLAMPMVEPQAVFAPRKPDTPIEKMIATIWREVLGLDDVSATDDFFHLGGHSLHAVRVISRLREAWAVDVPMHALFEAPTIEGLARLVFALRAASASASEKAELMAALDRLGAASETERPS